MKRRTEPVWLMPEAVMVLHEKLISQFGGGGGIRDLSLLDSALERPHNLSLYGKPSIFQLAAAYAYGLGKNHSFIDGNKRIAFLAAVTFLERNGHHCYASEADALIQTVALVTGDISERDYANWLNCACDPAYPTRN